MIVYLYWSRRGTGRFELVAGCRLRVAAELLCPEFVCYIMCVVQC